jgi:transposase-like protein
MERAKCPKCGSTKVVWRGFRYNEKSKKRMRLCKSCGRKFTPDPMYFRMRFAPEEIMDAVGLYKKGFSSTEVQRNLKRKGIKVSRWTIILWSRKYGGAMEHPVH